MADSAPRKALHPFFAVRSQERPSPQLHVTGKSALDQLLQTTILNITQLARTSNPDPQADKPNPSEETSTSEPVEGISGAMALARYRNALTVLERGEIMSYKQVYFLGLKAVKNQGDVTMPNCGFDEENGDYREVVGDHLGYRFEVIEGVGRGAFGKVVKCWDHKEREMVAVKITRNNRRFHYQLLQEIQLLEHLSAHHVQRSVSLRSHFRFREHLCLVFELLALSLFDQLRLTQFRGFPVDSIKSVTKGVAEGLAELKENRVIHCDLKPENVLFAASDQLQVRLIDFGSACFESSQIYTYIQSRFYRAPEILLGSPYSYPIDMWSLGCLVAEMSTGRPLLPGESERDQLMWIVAALGEPGLEVVKRGKKAGAYFGEGGEWLEFTNTKGKRRGPGSLPLSRLLPNGDAVLLSFLSDCLKWEPEARLTPSQALQHPFLC